MEEDFSMFRPQLSDECRYALRYYKQRPFRGNSASFLDRLANHPERLTSQFGDFSMDHAAAIAYADKNVEEEFGRLREDESFGATLWDCKEKPGVMVKEYPPQSKAEWLAAKAAAKTEA